MAKPLQSLCKLLSDWEVEEARFDHERGTTMKALAFRYKVSEKCLQRAFKRMDERKGGDRMSAKALSMAFGKLEKEEKEQ